MQWHKRSSNSWLFVSLALIAGALPVRAEVTLPHVFGSNMVLQRRKPLPVWGWAAAGEKVSVQLADGPPVTTTANDQGEWRVALPAREAGGPFAMKVTGNNEVTLDNVRVGEVWLCSGQSNMQMSVAGSLNAPEEIAAAQYPNIRLLSVPLVPQPLPVKDVNADWKVCSPETVGGFSACGYFFGRYLHKELNVPIGLINSSWGGTRIEPWTPPAGFAAVPALADIQKQVLLTDPAADLHKEALAKYLETAEGWTKTARQALADETVLQPIPEYPKELLPLTSREQPQQQPTTLYNGMIHALVPFAMRGAIWYQGESNHGEGKLYTEKTKALVAGWRQVWGDDTLAYYYVQIAPYQYGNENPYITAEFWEAQAAALEIPNTGMAVINDVGNTQDIHPKNKQEVGRRLGLLALAKTYGKADVVCSGPTFKALKPDGNKLRVQFDDVGGGLASRDGQPLTWFEIIGADTDFAKADAVIEGDTVVLTAPEVKAPVAVQFAWNKLAEPNLMNKEGLPAWPFRAGTVPERDYLALKVAEAKDYQLVYELDLAKAAREIVYDQDLRARVAGAFDRIAYFLELQKAGEQTQWVYVSMDAFTDDLAKIGVPTLASKAVFQQKVTNMNVLCSVAGIATGEGLAGGNIEFWPHNYGPTNSASIPDASDALWDFGDQRVDPEDGYGCMQVHNCEAKQTIFAFNSWKSGAGANIGIGNSSADERTCDWTFVANANQYVVKKLRVLVRVKK